jgi:hypothetical protein
MRGQIDRTPKKAAVGDADFASAWDEAVETVTEDSESVLAKAALARRHGAVRIQQRANDSSHDYNG